MISSDLSTISEVLSHYPVGRLERGQRAAGGLTNENWIVDTTTGRYFLRKRSRIFGKSSIAFETGLIEHLMKKGFPTPALIGSSHGETSVDLDGRIFELYSFIEGEKFDTSNLEQVRSAGRLLAKFHLSALDYDFDACALEERQIALEAVDERIEAFERALLNMRIIRRLVVPAIVAFMRTEARRAFLCMRSLEGCPRGVVHGDFQPSNIIFRGDEAAALLDFDMATVFYRVYDVAVAILRFSALKPGYRDQSDLNPRLDMERASAFLEAYQEDMPLDAVEKRVIPALVRAVYLYALVVFMERERSRAHRAQTHRAQTHRAQTHRARIRQALWIVHAFRFTRWMSGPGQALGDILGLPSSGSSSDPPSGGSCSPGGTSGRKT